MCKVSSDKNMTGVWPDGTRRVVIININDRVAVRPCSTIHYTQLLTPVPPTWWHCICQVYSALLSVFHFSMWPPDLHQIFSLWVLSCYLEPQLVHHHQKYQCYLDWKITIFNIICLLVVIIILGAGRLLHTCEGGAGSFAALGRYFKANPPKPFEVF